MSLATALDWYDEPTRQERERSEPAEPTSSMGLYLKEIRRTRLLTADEERELGLRIERGDEDARAVMIQSNLRLVVRIAKRYVNRGLPYVDLVEEGNVGLIKAVERFKVEKGCRFSTYATWWIRQSIERAITNQAHTIRLPVHVSDHAACLARMEDKLTRSLRRSPTDEELSEATGFTLEYVARLRSVRRRVLSLDQPMDANVELTLGDRLEDPCGCDPADALHQAGISRAVLGKFASLTQRERKILSLRFGLEGDDGMTLDAIGKVLGLTRERIRQIQAEALGKLRRLLSEEGIHAYETN